MHTYILDIDGTLIPSHQVDNECYWRAVRDEYKVDLGVLPVDGFSDITDLGILNQWVRERFGREPTGGELERVKQRFLDYLETAAGNRAQEFMPTAGVEAWLDRIKAANGQQAGIATGGWGHTARFKLAWSGLARYDLPLACSDDAVSRTGIMRHALELLVATDQQDADCVTYIGDGPWDAAAAQHLGWAFIGIAGGERAAALREAGAEAVYEDFSALPGD